MHVADVGGTRVNISNVGGTLYGVEDTCTHMGCSLARGRLNGTIVTCACHGSQFDVTTGSVIRGPAQRPVRAQPIQVVGEDVLADVRP
jgi:nitrite reductase/ring-hydroxylating ferredoxin subunit